MGNNSVPKFIFRFSRFPVYKGSVLGRFYCIIILWDHLRICIPSLTGTSWSGANLYTVDATVFLIPPHTTVQWLEAFNPSFATGRCSIQTRPPNIMMKMIAAFFIPSRQAPDEYLKLTWCGSTCCVMYTERSTNIRHTQTLFINLLEPEFYI